VPLVFPEGCTIDIVGRRLADSVDERAVLTEAVSNPIGASSFGEFLRDARLPLVVVNDATRSTPTEAMLTALMPDLERSPNWRVIIATGLHRAPTELELARIFGSLLDIVRDRILVHNGYDRDTHQAFESGDGPLYLNRAVRESDRLILLSSVEPHFFAGYTGGRKSIVPGLAGKESVERSHAGAVTLDAHPLKVDGNPVRDYIHKNTAFIDTTRAWSIQAVLDANDHLAAAFAGEIDKTFSAACDVAQKYYVCRIAEAYDMVLAAVYPPLDVNLYQAQKGWELSQFAVKDQGALIVTSPCTEGIGSPFYATLSETFPKKGEWISLAEQPYTMGLHKLVRTGRIRARARLLAVTNMQPEDIAPFGYDGFTSIEDAINEAVAHVGTPARVLIVEDAGLTTVVRD